MGADGLTNVTFAGHGLEEQMATLSKLYVQTEFEVEQKQQLKARLHTQIRSLLGSTLGAYALVLFGSSVTGLGHNGDADICILTEKPPSASTKQMVLQQIAAGLRALGYTEVRTVLNAKCPVVKAVDPVYKIPVDLSMERGLGLRNSGLMKAYLDAHTSLRPVILSLKAWRTASDLHSLTTYTLSLMVIGYMQQMGWIGVLQHPTTPSRLSTSAQSQQGQGLHIAGQLDTDWLTKPGPCTINVWDCYYGVHAGPPALHPGPAKILQGFFAYYKDYSYDRSFVSISGNVQGNSYFKPFQHSVSMLRRKFDDEPGKMKMRSPLCVQDPFELSHNTAQSIHEEHYEPYMRHMGYAHAVLSQGGDLNQLLHYARSYA